MAPTKKGPFQSRKNQAFQTSTSIFDTVDLICIHAHAPHACSFTMSYHSKKSVDALWRYGRLKLKICAKYPKLRLHVNIGKPRIEHQATFRPIYTIYKHQNH